MMPQDPALLDPETSNMINAFCGGTYNPKILQLVSPIFYVEKGKNYVPFLIAHGNADPLVPFSQSEQMVKRLEECGADVSFICVDHAEHEGSFWSLPLLDLFIEFFNRQSKLHCDTPTRVLANGRGFLRHGRTPQRTITSPLHLLRVYL